MNMSQEFISLHPGSITSPASYKRGKRPVPRDEIERFDEEEWPLRDVIFVEDTRPVPIGEVLAVDGNQVCLIYYRMW